jgi:hypothetical protein
MKNVGRRSDRLPQPTAGEVAHDFGQRTLNLLSAGVICQAPPCRAQSSDDPALVGQRHGTRSARPVAGRASGARGYHREKGAGAGVAGSRPAAGDDACAWNPRMTCQQMWACTHTSLGERGLIKMSAFAHLADSSRTSRKVRDVPILLQKSFCTRDQNFFWLYRRLPCKYVGDLIVRRKTRWRPR